MTFVFVSYQHIKGFSTPESWLKRIEGYAGVYECLSKTDTVINVQQIDYQGQVLHNGVRHEFVSFGRPASPFAFRLNRFVRDLQPDIVVIHGLHQPLQLLRLRYMLPRKTKIMVQHHGEVPFSGLKKYLQRAADRYTDGYLFAARGMGLNWVRQGNLAAPEKIREVTETSSIFYPVARQPARHITEAAGHPMFLWVGRLNANKDPLNVVRAFLRFTLISPGARLYMIYHTTELLPEIRELLDAHPEGRKIILVGKVEHDQLLYWFNAADFFLSGSWYEAGGTVVCEAMSCGCIPIVTDILPFRRTTNEGRCGILYQPGSENGLLAALVETSRIRVPEKRQLCLSWFKSRLSFEAIARQIHEIAASL